MSPRNEAPSTWSLPVSMLAIGGGLPAIFWARFGYLDGYAWGMTAFFMLLALAVHYLPRKVDELAPYSEAARVPRGRFDFLGVVWLLSIPFAPFFAWILTSMIDIDADNWRLPVTARAVLCVVVPVVSVLPLIKYVRGKPAAFASAVLTIGTAFPVLTGLGCAQDAVRGPAWEDVVVERLEDIAFRTGAGTRVETPDAFVHLVDGRRLTRASAAHLRPGPAHVLVLRGLGRIIAAT